MTGILDDVILEGADLISDDCATWQVHPSISSLGPLAWLERHHAVSEAISDLGLDDRAVDGLLEARERYWDAVGLVPEMKTDPRKGIRSDGNPTISTDQREVAEGALQFGLGVEKTAAALGISADSMVHHLYLLGPKISTQMVLAAEAAMRSGETNEVAARAAGMNRQSMSRLRRLLAIGPSSRVGPHKDPTSGRWLPRSPDRQSAEHNPKESTH